MSDSLCPIIIIRNLFKVRARAASCSFVCCFCDPRGLLSRILGDPGAVSRVGRKGATKVFKYGRKHPRRPRDSQSGREKRRDESFQVRAKEPLGTDSHLASSKNSSGWRLLIGYKKCFVLLCPIGEQFLLSSFLEFVHDGYCLATLVRFVHQACASKGNFYFLLS